MISAYQFPNYWITEEGQVINKKTNKILTPVPQNGYMQVRLSDGKKIRCKSLHRLIYQSFKGKIKEGYQINHINGIRSDNHLSNLEEVTPKENWEKMLFLRKGSEVNTSKLTEVQVMEIRKRKANGERSLDLANEYEVTKSAINRLAKGITWKHLPLLGIDNTLWKNPELTGAMSKQTLEKKYGKDYFSKIAQGKKFIKHCNSCTCTDNGLVLN